LTAPPPDRAATLILLRERDGSPPETLMIQRSAAMAFGAGAWVFPGGRVDPGDVALAQGLQRDDLALDDLAARIAAIRETIEEAGVAIGLSPLPDRVALAALRAGLHAGEAFAGLLDRFGLALAPDALIPFSRWWPPESASRRFDTRFYIARAPAHADIAADGGETVAIDWIQPPAMLARQDVRLMFPTVCNLRRIAAYEGFPALAADAALFPASFVVAEIREIDGQDHLCVPEGQGYGDMREALAGARRG
jgi:8-oxo-dGTP pyrophosphatase MutT (NUDIX family)